MEFLLGIIIGLAGGAVGGRMTAPKAEPPTEDAARIADLERRLKEAGRAKMAAETALREAEAAPAPAAAATPAPAASSGDADLLAAENAALRKALSDAEARAKRASMG